MFTVGPTAVVATLRRTPLFRVRRLFEAGRRARPFDLLNVQILII